MCHHFGTFCLVAHKCNPSGLGLILCWFICKNFFFVTFWLEWDSFASVRNCFISSWSLHAIEFSNPWTNWFLGGTLTWQLIWPCHICRMLSRILHPGSLQPLLCLLSMHTLFDFLNRWNYLGQKVLTRFPTQFVQFPNLPLPFTSSKCFTASCIPNTKKAWNFVCHWKWD